MNGTKKLLSHKINYTENVYKIMYSIKLNMKVYVMFSLKMLMKTKTNLFYKYESKKKIELFW